jgi:hypothetical protein
MQNHRNYAILGLLKQNSHCEEQLAATKQSLVEYKRSPRRVDDSPRDDDMR